MSGVIVSMRRTLLSCTSLARNSMIMLAVTGPGAAISATSAHADEVTLLQQISGLFELNHQEFAVLTTALALLGFTVVAAILLMRTRVRATKIEARLRSDIQGLQMEADRFRALLFAEPQILISWAAGDNRPEISGDISLVLPQQAHAAQPQRVLAFGTWLPPEPALQMDHAVDALRESGEGFLLNLTTSNGHAFEAMGRAIGGQAIVRIRELGGLRRELAETNLRHKALVEETEMLRGFAAAVPWPIWAKRTTGGLSYANAAYARATEAASATDAINRGLELLDSADRGEMERALEPAHLNGDERPHVYFEEWPEPLMAAGNWIPELTDMLGAENLFGSAGVHSPWLQWEDILKADPDVIVSMPCGYDLKRTREEMHWHDWTNLRAQVFLADGNQYLNRPGPRVAKSLRILAEILYPETFEPTLEGIGWEKF